MVKTNGNMFFITALVYVSNKEQRTNRTFGKIGIVIVVHFKKPACKTCCPANTFGVKNSLAFPKRFVELNGGVASIENS